MNSNISIRFCILFGLMHFFVPNIIAQNISSYKDQSTTAKISLQEEQIETEGFPAISKDGKTIALVHSDYSCCISTQQEFRLISTKAATPNPYKVILYPQEDLPEFSHNKKVKIINKVGAILKKQPYYPLIEISSDSQVVEKKASSPNHYINIVYKGTTLKSKPFRLKKMKQPGFCCTGIPEENQPCYSIPNINHVWISINKKLILVEYGIGEGPTHSTDGCEVGPEYKVVGLE